jgi:hypothetical protein
LSFCFFVIVLYYSHNRLTAAIDATAAADGQVHSTTVVYVLDINSYIHHPSIFVVFLDELPGPNDLTLGTSAHADIGALGGLVRNEKGNSRKSNHQDSKDGVGGRVTEPSLGKRVLGHSAAGADGTSSRATHHAGLKSGGTVML